MLIRDATFVVVDVETTGLAAGPNSLIEIGAVALRGHTVVDEYHSMVNPGGPVPAHITSITGIRTEDVIQAPGAAEVMPAFQEFLGEAVFVAHSASFDLKHINAALAGGGFPNLSNDTLCTLRLARRVLIGLPSKALGALIQFYGLTVDGRHRALSDARATAHVLCRLLQRLESAHELVELDELLRFQRRRIRKAGNHLEHVRKRVLPKLPERPGVYYFLGTQHRVLYVGKASDLSKRVRSYFAGIEGHPSNTRKLMSRVRDVRWDPVDTELEALILESRKIKTLQPRFNLQAVKEQAFAFVRLGPILGRPWVTMVRHIEMDGARYYGPFTHRNQAAPIAEMLACLYGAARSANTSAGPGARRIGGPLTQSGLCEARQFLDGFTEPTLGDLASRMWTASDENNYELARKMRDWAGLSEQLSPLLEVSRGPILKLFGAMVLRGVNGAVAQFLAGGRPIGALRWPADQEQLDAAARQLVETTEQAPAQPGIWELDAARITAQWMVRERERLQWIGLDAAKTASEFAAQVRSTLQAVT